MHWQWLFRGGVQLLANDTTVLNTVEVSTDYLGESTENSNSYGYKASKAATGLELSILRTPQSTDALTYRNLRDNTNSTYSANEALNNVIGVSSVSWDSQRVFFQARKMFMRNIAFDGQESAGFPDADGAITPNMTDISLYDRIEIVRGSTGVMRGAGNPSAAVNFVRKVPSINKDFAKLGLSAGSWSFKRADLDASYALNEDRSIRTRLNFATQKANSYIDRYTENRDVIYGVVDFDIGENSLLRLGADFSNRKTKGQMYGEKADRLHSVDVDGNREWNTELTNYPINYNFAPKWAGADTKRNSQFIKFNHIFNNDYEINFDYSRENLNQDWIKFWAASINKNELFEFADVIKTKDKYKTDNFSLKLNGSYNIANLNNDFIFGLNHAKTNLNQKFYYVEGYNVETIPYKGYFFRNDFPKRLNFKSDNDGVLDSINKKQKSVLLNNKTDFTDSLSLILGLRFTKYNEVSNSNKYLASYKINQTNLSKYIGLTYEYFKGHSVYASISDIFTPQEKIDKNRENLKPIIGTNYEVGLKSQFFDNNLNVNLALFEIRRDGVAIDDLENSTDTETFYKSINGAKNRGFELSAIGNITNNLSIYSGYTYTTAKDASGKDIFTEIPSKTFKLGLDYEPMLGFNFGGNLRWQNSTYREFWVDGSHLDVKSRTIVDLHSSYNITKKFRVQANINNIFNKKYRIENWGVFYKDGEPRNFMFRAEYVF